MTYPTISIISFDLQIDAAAVELAEDRSLNLMLRQRRIRSEIYRLSVAPQPNEIELLSEILASTPQRPLVMLLRNAETQRMQQAAVAAFANAALNCTLVHIGDDLRTQYTASSIRAQFFLASDHTAAIKLLAEEVAAHLALG